MEKCQGVSKLVLGTYDVQKYQVYQGKGSVTNVKQEVSAARTPEGRRQDTA